ncbi:MAG: D-glycero-beta-D-manno-heptose 1-phosphate adenylyltransferase [Gemmatimonadales bacterium]
MSSGAELPEVLRRKILTREAAQVEYGPGRDCRLVFTNGCFDILHRGHVQLLVQARQLGDRLLVGLNSDGSTRRLKGSGRPLQPQLDRAACLAALECVDAVVVFDEDTPADLIASLQPDIMVKGGDYAPEQLPEREVVEAGGGRIVILPYIEGLSTTELLERAHRMNER